MKPATPGSLEGAPLSDTQKKRLPVLIGDISAVNPGRRAQANLAQAVSAFRMTVKRGRGWWVDLPHFRIAGGRGPVVVPSWMRQ